MNIKTQSGDFFKIFLQNFDSILSFIQVLLNYWYSF